MKDIIVIIGPTGVGKTKLSVELAKKIDAEIINGDAMQVYKHLNIGTAKVNEEEKEGIKHHLFDIKEINEDYSVYDYQRDARKKIEEISSRGKRIIIVGGTGLYIKATLYDYRFTPNTIINDYADLSNEEILLKIKKYDENTLIHVNNRKRLVRCLNKYENKEEVTYNKDKLLYNVKVIALTTARDNLYKRINDRVDIMIKAGLVEEVKQYKNYFKTSKALNTGIGYKEFYDYFYNGKDLSLVVEDIKKNSRKYAKRQYTFFRHQFEAIWLDVNFEDFTKTVNNAYNYIKK